MVFRFNLFTLSGFCLDWSVYFFTFFWQRGFRNVQNDLIEEGRVEEQRISIVQRSLFVLF